MVGIDLDVWEMQEAEALARRLKLLVRKNGGNAAVSEKTGIKLSTLNSYLAGVEPKFSVVVRLAEALGLPLSALVGDDPEIQEPARPEGMISIPMRDVYASAGPGAEIGDEPIIGHMQFPEVFVRSWGRSPARVEAVQALGDSMLPTIQDRQWVLIDRADRELLDGGVYGFRTPDGLRLKRFQKAIDGTPMLVSDNRDLYAPERLSPKELAQLRIAGRAFLTPRML